LFHVRKRLVNHLFGAGRRVVHKLSITHKFGFLVHDRFDFVGGEERDVHGALARASRRSASMSL
jgi:hypothetical protein